jgi:hypothetical protein
MLLFTTLKSVNDENFKFQNKTMIKEEDQSRKWSFEAQTMRMLIIDEWMLIT